MANPKYELTITCKSPRSPQSTEKINKETGDARENIKSMNSNFFDEFEYGNQSNCINSNIRNDSFATTKVTLKDTVDQILTDDPAQIMEVNESFDLNSEIQGSLCSQCKFTNRLNSYIERGINSSVEMEKEFQEYFAMSETSSFSPAMNGTVDLSESVCDDKTKSVTGCISPSILNSSYHSIGLQNSSSTHNLLLESNRPQISEQYLNETEKTALELEQSLTKNSVEICNGKSSKDQFTCKRSLTMSWNSETCLVESIPSKKTHFNSLRKFKSEDNILAKLTGSKSDSRNKFSVLPDKFMSDLIEGFGLIPFIKGNHSTEIINENVSNALTLRQSKNKCLDDWYNDKVNTENSKQFSVLLQTDFEKLEDIKQGEMGMDLEQTCRTSKSISFETSDIFLKQLTPSQNLNVQDTLIEDSSSIFNQSTIEEVYFMDSNDNIDCSTTNEKFQILSQHKTDENDSLQCTLNDKMIGDTSTTEKLVDLNLQQLANSTTQPIHDESKKNNITVNRDSGSIVATIDSKTGYNEMQSSCTDPTLKSNPHLSVIQLKVMQNEKETTVKTINLINPIDDPGKSSESLRDQQLGNEKGLEISSNSFLEFSIESQMDTIREKDTLRKKEIIPIHTNNSITSFTTSQNLSVENAQTRNRQLAVLNTVNTNAGGETINLPDNVNTEFMIREKLNSVEKEDERTLEKKMLSNLTNNLFPNVGSTQDENIWNTNRQTPPGDFSLDMLSESQLQTIETEAYVKVEKIDVVQLKKKATTEGGVNKQNIFFKPEQTGITTTDKNDLVLPNWVTNRAPEPDYDKMRRAFQNRRQYVKILLQEILRLSTIVSKVGAVLRAEHAENNLKPHVDSVDEATICETPSNTKTNVRTSNNAAKDLKNKNIFYVPPSNMPFPNIPQDFPNNINNPPNSTGASINTVTLENSVCTDITTDLKREKFYVPPTNKSNYDTLPAVNQQMDTKFKDGQITEAFVRHNASNMFGSLKQISNNHKTYKPDIRSIWHSSGQESGSILETSFSRNKVPKNNQTVRQQIAAGYEMPQSNLNASVFTNNMAAKNVEGKSNICDLDHSKLANKNTIFYVPDEGSSVSGDYIGLGSIKNDSSRCYKFSMPSKSQTRSNENSKLLVNDILPMNTQKAQSNRKNLENLQLTVKNDIFYSPDESSVSNNTLFTSKFAESSGTKSDPNFFYYANFPMPFSSHLRSDQHLKTSNSNVVISNRLKRKSNIHDVNNAKRARENTTFYSPEKLSLPSKDLFSTSDYMEIRDTTNPGISSRNCSLPSSHVKLGRPPRLLNNTAVFYNGNEDQETGFRKPYRH